MTRAMEVVVGSRTKAMQETEREKEREPVSLAAAGGFSSEKVETWWGEKKERAGVKQSSTA